MPLVVTETVTIVGREGVMKIRDGGNVPRETCMIGSQSRLISWDNECTPTIKILGSLVARRMRLRAAAKLCVLRARDHTLD